MGSDLLKKLEVQMVTCQEKNSKMIQTVNHIEGQRQYDQSFCMIEGQRHRNKRGTHIFFSFTNSHYIQGYTVVLFFFWKIAVSNVSCETSHLIFGVVDLTEIVIT
jgi:hypothetical protein